MSGSRGTSRTYRGSLRPDGVTEVLAHGRPLLRGVHVGNEPPVNFSWGADGPGAAQLSLAILCDHFKGDSLRALALYQVFKEKVVARLPRDSWTLVAEDVAEAVRVLEDAGGEIGT